MAFSPQQAILALGDGFYDPVEPARFPRTILRFRNDRAAAQVGLETLDDTQWLAHFARFDPLPGSLPRPLALRYHGHQFRVYNPEIGDGRGFLFAQLRDTRGRLLDLGTKGSGQTPYSRFGDGRLTLKGAVREILASEMLEALGVETSRTFSVVETGESLQRNDEPSPTRSAVLVRLSHSHIRIGTFQRLAYFHDTDGLVRLTRYVLHHYFGEPAAPATPDDEGLPADPEAPARLLAHVVAATARMAGQFMAAGFVHGVLNSDNINVTGESFDYGPWRFTPRWDEDFTAAYFDHGRLYAFGRQPEAIYWDVMQLAVALRLIADQEALIAAMEGFADAFHQAFGQAVAWRLGLEPRGGEADIGLARAVQGALSRTGTAIDDFFFAGFGGNLPGHYGEPFDGIRLRLRDYAVRRKRDHRYWADPRPCGMPIEDVEAIWSRIADADDWEALHAKVAAIRRMGEALA